MSVSYVRKIARSTVGIRTVKLRRSEVRKAGKIRSNTDF